MEAACCYILVGCVSIDHVERVKDSAFNDGAGKVGNYERGTRQTSGTAFYPALAVATQPTVKPTMRMEK